MVFEKPVEENSEHGRVNTAGDAVHFKIEGKSIKVIPAPKALSAED